MQKLVFFDCECANTKGGFGKICSLGYVVCDQDFNVLEHDDIVMNPQSAFDWYLFTDKGGCKLAYSKEYFCSQPSFPNFYNRIKTIFTQKDEEGNGPLVVGFAVGNDVDFLNAACNRYQLPPFDYKAIDIAKLLENHFETTKRLSDWTDFFGLKDESLVAHNSESDAMMTLLCLKHLCEVKNMSVSQLFEENKGMFFSSIEKERIRRIKDSIRSLYDKRNFHSEYSNVADVHFQLDKKLLHNPDKALSIIKKIYNNGGVVHKKLVRGSGYVVFENEITAEDKEKLDAKELKGITLLELLEILD